MNVKQTSDGVLIYDRYYRKKPHPFLLALEKILLCCALCFCSVMYLMSEYELFPDRVYAACAAAGFGALFSLVFVFVKKRYALPVMLLGAGAYVWLDREDLWESLSYFVDAAMLNCEGRFVAPRQYLWHNERLLSPGNPLFVEGVTTGCLIACALYALICAASLSKKPRALPVTVTFVLLCIPRIIAERLEFDLWLIPTIALLAAVTAMSKSYSGGLAIKQGATRSYKKSLSDDERDFSWNLRKAPYIKSVEMRCGFYSKYVSVGMYCAALFSVTMLSGSLFFETGSSIDYSGVYELVQSIGEDTGITDSPFDEGPMSEYFTRPEKPESSNYLNITSPGTGEQDIIRVKTQSERPVYLRGDIGIDFKGTFWTSPAAGETQSWLNSGLKEKYRPCEALVGHSLLATQHMAYSSLSDNIYTNPSAGIDLGSDALITAADVVIDYLCDTSVVFLPAYTAEFSYYNSERFKTFGDVVVRVNEDFGVVNTVQCTALFPAYTNTDEGESGGEELVESLESLYKNSFCSVNSVYDTVVPEMAGTPNLILLYGQFVADTYTDVPAEMSGSLSEFISAARLYDTIDSEWDGNSESAYRYLCARVVADYLRDNYTYTLNSVNDLDNPVMSFLNDKKQGHCSLYASAMTLILREMGIPARYCTGFVARPNSIGTTTLKAKNLHAWCEVYLGEIGWATFDPTSSSLNPENSPAAPQPPETVSPVPEITHRPEVTSKPPAPDISEPHAPDIEEELADGGFDFSVIVPYLPAILGAAAGLALIITVICLYSRLKNSAAKKLKDLRNAQPSDAAKEIYRIILDQLEICGIVPDKGELPGGFFERADRRFCTCLAPQTELLEELAFGKAKVTADERNFLSGQLETLTEMSVRCVGLIKRVRLQRAYLRENEHRQSSGQDKRLRTEKSRL